MLDSETKRRIDTARDILVGKVPDPKSQVEQITIALIYKFMDDMDAQAEELGGKRKFFAGEFARYGWAKLMRSGLGGHETLDLYAEGIAKMPENPGIPPLFRDIFKNAFLPYRDPETLSAFLKIIDEFEYDHSERLGDAFEYLLSVLGSQGDAGQFRTPRHIIDFIVAIVDPKKTETVLDPACGTAGFLISVLQAHPQGQQHDAQRRQQRRLHPRRPPRATLLRRARTRRQLPRLRHLPRHGPPVAGEHVPARLHRPARLRVRHAHQPGPLERDGRRHPRQPAVHVAPRAASSRTTASPSRPSAAKCSSSITWPSTSPPAAARASSSPRGSSSRARRPTKHLRKMLVEQYLVAVVSLPAGVFNPYSGVKTSILILDKSLAKQSRHGRLLQGGERRLRSRRPAPAHRQERPAAGAGGDQRIPAATAGEGSVVARTSRRRAG